MPAGAQGEPRCAGSCPVGTNARRRWNQMVEERDACQVDLQLQPRAFVPFVLADGRRNRGHTVGHFVTLRWAVGRFLATVVVSVGGLCTVLWV
jgi:hypothetical protein